MRAGSFIGLLTDLDLDNGRSYFQTLRHEGPLKCCPRGPALSWLPECVDTIIEKLGLVYTWSSTSTGTEMLGILEEKENHLCPLGVWNGAVKVHFCLHFSLKTEVREMGWKGGVYVVNLAKFLDES